MHAMQHTCPGTWVNSNQAVMWRLTEKWDAKVTSSDQIKRVKPPLIKAPLDLLCFLWLQAIDDHWALLEPRKFVDKLVHIISSQTFYANQAILTIFYSKHLQVKYHSLPKVFVNTGRRLFIWSNMGLQLILFFKLKFHCIIDKVQIRGEDYSPVEMFWTLSDIIYWILMDERFPTWL